MATNAQRCTTLAAAALISFCLTGVAQAQTLLTLVRGPEILELTLADLTALPQHTIVTENEFTSEAVAYTGPLARDVLELLAMDGVEEVRFQAINDYYIDVPTDELHRYEVILALEADGRRLSRRDKGPLWLMYPMSDHPELVGPVYNARLIWQVVKAESL